MKKYRKPPIIERALVVHAPLTEEQFQLRAEQWSEKVKPEFPQAETVTEWLITLTEKDGLPVLASDTQRMSIRQTFWEMHEGKKHKGVQMWNDKIAFNLLAIPDNAYHFEDLEAFAYKWIPQWAEHFGIQHYSGVSMEYVNLLSAKTIPDFVHDDALNISQVLNVFGNVPGPRTSAALIPPYDFTLNFQIKDSQPKFRTAVRCHNESGNESSLKLRLTATSHDESQRISLDDVVKQVKMAHQLILTEFDSFFTIKAKLTFDPYDAEDGTAGR